MPRSRVASKVNLPPFQALLDAHGRDVHRFLVATVGHSAADDCYQETWLAALRAYPRLRNATNLRAWILTIAHRKTIDHFRARRRGALPVAEVPERTAPPHGSAVGVPEILDGPAAGVPEILDGLATGGPEIVNGQTELWDQVRALPPKQRTAVALRYVFDAPYAEIASAMGTSEEAARRNVHEGLKRLRTEYKP
jgi:RNA polymerase sigma factor (sigma-70 family)